MRATWRDATRCARSALVWCCGPGLLGIAIGLAAACSPWDHRGRVHDLLARRWAGLILGLCGARLEFLGHEHIRAEARYVVAANHQSLLDILVLLATVHERTPIRFVAKRELGRLPILGWAMRRFGHPLVHRGNLRASRPGLEQAEHNLLQWSVAIFPEGTRSASGRLGSFRRGAARIAARAGAPLLPVMVTGTREMLPKGSLLLRGPGRIQVRVLRPIEISSADDETVRRVTETCRRQIAEQLASHGGRL